MQRVITTAVVAALAWSGTLRAHHSQRAFDVSTPIWLKGTVVRYDVINPHTLFELQTKDGGVIQRWTVQGPNLARLARLGADEHSLKAGDVIEVCGFAFNEQYMTQGSWAMFVHGQVLVMPDGKMRAWGPYGRIDNCVRPDDQKSRWLDFLNSDPLARETWCDKARRSIPTRDESKALVDEISSSAPALCDPGTQ